MKNLILFLLVCSCACSNLEKQTSNNKIVKEEPEIKNFLTESISTTEKIDEKRSTIINSIGVVVWKGQEEDTVFIYDKPGYPANYFPFRDLRKSKINPFAFNIDYYLLVFKCLGSESDYYKVVFDEDNPIKTIYIKKNLSFKFESWEKHILNLFSVGIFKKDDLKIEANEKSATNINIDWEDNYLRPISVKGNWLKVEWEFKDKKFYGWVKWRDDKRLLVEFFYFS